MGIVYNSIMNLGEIIKTLRLDKKMYQSDLAKILNVSQSIVSDYENNIVEPSLQTIRNLSKFFDVSTDYLLGLEDEFGNKIK